MISNLNRSAIARRADVADQDVGAVQPDADAKRPPPFATPRIWLSRSSGDSRSACVEKFSRPEKNIVRKTKSR